MANTFKNAAVAAGTGDTTLYTCPGSTTAVVHAIMLTNVDGANSATVTVKVTDSSAATTYTILQDAPVPAGSTLVFDKPVNLEDSDVLKVSAGATNDISAFASVLEIT